MKQLVKLLLIVGLLMPVISFAQKGKYNGFPSLVWPKLYNIQFEKADEEGFEKPLFTDDVKALHGKTISLPGYMVPFDNGIKGKHFMVSSLPLNACFFCGVGGPETVIEIYAKEPVAFTEKPIEVRGTLKVNDTDPDKMIYILENAVLLGEIEF